MLPWPSYVNTITLLENHFKESLANPKMFAQKLRELEYTCVFVLREALGY